MKKRLLVLLALIFVSSSFLKADKYYDYISLKTNLLSFWNIGVEFPLKDRYSLELNTRRAGSGFNSEGLRRDKRINIKYHLAIPALESSMSSAYILAGLHHKYRVRNDFSQEGPRKIKAELNTLRLVAGFGVRYRKFDVWIAAESAIAETSNFKIVYDGFGSKFIEQPWKSRTGLSCGLAWNFLSFRKADLNQNLFEEIGLRN